MEKRRKSQTQNEKKLATRKQMLTTSIYNTRKKGKLTVLQTQCPNLIRRYILLKKSWEVEESGKITVHGNSFFFFFIYKYCQFTLGFVYKLRNQGRKGEQISTRVMLARRKDEKWSKTITCGRGCQNHTKKWLCKIWMVPLWKLILI